MRFSFIALLAFALVAVLTVGPSTSSSSAAVDFVRVFIDLPDGYGAQEDASIRAAGGRTRHLFVAQSTPTISVELPEHVVPILANNPRFSFIRPVPDMEIVEDNLPWGVDRIDAEVVWGGSNGAVNVSSGRNSGAGMRIAIIDTGIANHTDLKIVGGTSFVSTEPSYSDGHGHGTHVAGSAAAKDNGTGVLGVAPGADLLAVKVLSSSGSGKMDDVAAGINWAAQNGANVINMSLSCSGTASACNDTVMQGALQNATNAGVVIVAAAGNSGSGTNTVGWPAQDSRVIAVAATTNSSNNARASFSSTGPAVEISAPGEGIYSTYPGGYATMSGTSMASPHVAGVAALLMACGNSASQTRSIMQSTAIDLGTSGRDDLYGYGLVRPNPSAVCSTGGASATATPTPSSTSLSVTEGFESNSWTGGAGWSSNWSRSGSSSYTSILTSASPQEGARHARLRANGGITRTFSTSGVSAGTLTYYAKRNTGVSGSDRIHVEVSTNGSSWTSLQQHSSTDTSTGYQQYTLTLPGQFLNQSTVYLRFRGAMNSSGDYFYLDAISITGSGGAAGNPSATNTPVPTATNTPPPQSTATNTPIPPTATNTSVPPTATNTSVPPTATNTPPTPPTATATTPPSTCLWWQRLFGWC